MTWTYTLWVNRKSGTAHTRRSCKALNGVPDGALRLVELDYREDPPPIRWCSWCAGFSHSASPRAIDYADESSARPVSRTDG